MPRGVRPLIPRFWAKVKKAEGDGCWEWIGGKTGGARAKKLGGYGVFRLDNKRCAAHRIAYELTYGPIPAGLLVCHKCDNPPCVRPDHLFLGTAKDNQQDCAMKGRRNPNPRHDVRGPNAKLSPAKVEAIRTRSAQGEMLTALAKEYGVSLSLVSRVVHRQRWAA